MSNESYAEHDCIGMDINNLPIHIGDTVEFSCELVEESEHFTANALEPDGGLVITNLFSGEDGLLTDAGKVVPACLCRVIAGESASDRIFFYDKEWKEGDQVSTDMNGEPIHIGDEVRVPAQEGIVDEFKEKTLTVMAPSIRTHVSAIRKGHEQYVVLGDDEAIGPGKAVVLVK